MCVAGAAGAGGSGGPGRGAQSAGVPGRGGGQAQPRHQQEARGRDGGAADTREMSIKCLESSHSGHCLCNTPRAPVLTTDSALSSLSHILAIPSI